MAGVRIYLGVYGTQASRRKYKDELRKWEAVQDRPEIRVDPGCTITELIAAFLKDARPRYQIEGEATGSMRRFASAFAPLEPYSGGPADEFRGNDLRTVRQKWIDAGMAQSTIASYVGTIRQLFRWGVEREIVDPATVVSLASVRSEGEGRETEPVGPVLWEQVERTLPKLSAPFQAMVRAQWLIACRPGEICRMCGRYIDQTGRVMLGRRALQLPAGVWVWQPRRYKTQKKVKHLTYLIGPKAQAILQPWLREDPDEYLFQPIQARQRKRQWIPPVITGKIYRDTVVRACLAAGVPPWTPNQLRHAALTRYDAAAGIEAASTIVGHATLDATMIYVEKNLTKAAELVKQMG